jgi:hypothetical protein
MQRARPVRIVDHGIASDVRAVVGGKEAKPLIFADILALPPIVPDREAVTHSPLNRTLDLMRQRPARM